MRSLTAGMLALALTACGLTQTRGPDPRRPADQRPTCTDSFAAPKRDGIGAVVGLVAIVFGGIALESDSGDDTLGAGLVIGGAAVMVASYVSGGIGYFRVKKCRRAIADYERRNAPQP
jgi:hypothetical protein